MGTKKNIEETELTAKYIADIYKILTFVLWTPLGSVCLDIFTGKIEFKWSNILISLVFALLCALLGLLTMASGHYVLLKCNKGIRDVTRTAEDD